MRQRKRVSTEVICGIYCIQNIINRKRYIGSSKDIYDRWLSHTRDLNNNKHHCGHLQNAWNKYGDTNFIFFIIEECPERERFFYEQFWYDYYRVYDDAYGYNSSEIATSSSSPFTLDDIISGKSIMSIEQFNQIIDYLVNTDLSIPKISEIVNIPKSTIYSIYFKEEYVALTKDYVFIKRENKGMAKLTPEVVQNIVDELVSGKIPAEVARLNNVNSHTVYDIRDHKTWREYTKNIIFPEVNGVHQPSKKKKAVCQYSFNGDFIAEYDSLSEADKQTGVSFKVISQCCNGAIKYANGYIWRFKGDDLNKYELPTRKVGKVSVDQYSPDGVFIKTFSSIAEAKKETGASTIDRVIRGLQYKSGGFRWARHGESLYIRC